MLGPCAEQIHPLTVLRSPCQLSLGVQTFTMALHISGPSCFAQLCPLQSVHPKAKAVSAANWLIPRDPCSWHGQGWQEGQMHRHLPDPNTWQLQPGLTKQRDTEFFP